MIQFKDLPNTDTPITAENLNNNFEEASIAISPTEPTTNEKVWFKKGKNLFNINNISGRENCSINTDGTIKCSISGTYYSSVYITYLNEFLLKNKGKTITLSMNVTSTNNIGLIIYGTRTSGENYQVVLNEPSICSLKIADDFTSISRLEIRFNAKSSAFTDTTTIASNIQLEQGTTATEYEPYVEKEIYIKNANGVFEQFTDIETIKNSNGTAIKYPDGTMICRGRFTLAGQITTAIGGGFYKYFAFDKPFPVEFIEQPTINATPVGDWVMIGTVRCDKSTISNITFFTLNTDATSKDYVTDYIAIGRWK